MHHPRKNMQKYHDGFSERQISQLRDLFVASEDRTKSELKDYIHQQIVASEHRVKAELRNDMSNLEVRILHGVADIMDNVVNPRFDDHDRRITWLERQSRLA